MIPPDLASTLRATIAEQAREIERQKELIWRMHDNADGREARAEGAEADVAPARRRGRHVDDRRAGLRGLHQQRHASPSGVGARKASA